ncbi:MAG: PKD domain-containing protein, partial [Nitrososphaeraceae archaeon]
KTNFTAPSNLQADTTLSFKLTVTDTAGLSNFDTVSILVRHAATPPPPPTETAPIAVVGPDQTLNESSVVTLDGSASHDPDGDPITFAWDQTSGPPVQLSTPNQAKTSFTAPSNLQEDATMFFKLTVTDKTGLSDSMVQKITVKRSTSPPPPPPPPPENGTEQIYTAKPGGRVLTKMNPSGGNCKSDGIRFNIANEHTLVDRESTWIFTLNNDPKSCTDKPWWSPKIGSHGSTGEGSGLYEASVPYSGGFKSMRTEGPHPQYHSCSGYSHGDVPPMPKGKPIGIKTAQWRIPNGVHVEFWYDFTGGGKGPWKKYASLDDTLPGHCNGGSINGPIGMNGELIGPAKAQDTMRMNGGSATFISGSIVELAPGQSPRGSIDSSISSSSLSSETDNNAIAVPHAIAKESVFDKGLSDGEKDAKEIAPPTSAIRSDQKTIEPMTSDDVDCESPDNLSGQDSIDYCKGYDQGFAEQNNMMAEK